MSVWVNVSFGRGAPETCQSVAGPNRTLGAYGAAFGDRAVIFVLNVRGFGYGAVAKLPNKETHPSPNIKLRHDTTGRMAYVGSCSPMTLGRWRRQIGFASGWGLGHSATKLPQVQDRPGPGGG
jgi:hypothetical protein